MELGFVNKQLAALQQQHQEVIEQAGYYKAEHDTFKLEQDTLQNQLLSPGFLTPVTPAPTTPLQKLTQQASSPKLAKLLNPPVFTEDTQTDKISLNVWKIKMSDKIRQKRTQYPDVLAQLHYIFSQVGEATQAQLELYAEKSYTRALRLAGEYPGDTVFRSMFRILDNTFRDLD